MPLDRVSFFGCHAPRSGASSNTEPKPIKALHDAHKGRRLASAHAAPELIQGTEGAGRVNARMFLAGVALATDCMIALIQERRERPLLLPPLNSDGIGKDRREDV
jgi:hypothetical protein